MNLFLASELTALDSFLVFLIGMVVIFAILGLIILALYLVKLIIAPANTLPSVEPTVVKEENLIDDDELVAVITAAICATMKQNGEKISAPFKIKSIKYHN